ncbi:MAG TPA: molybdenum cofactor biosynthesis protein MoaE [Rhizomicrobium sp.]|nr:molybdenum cofactor biosynthesis protein MoaE [Rhizomicrobium sp.]
MRTIRIQREDFDIAAEIAALRRACPEAGAIVTFTGIVRADDGVTAMTLEHYPDMTEREIGRHVDEAGTRWPIMGTVIIHRIGTLMAGDNVVLVVTASAHREPAFVAAEFLMDYLKTRAPFWKEERRGDRADWVEARESDESAAKRWDER